MQTKGGGEKKAFSSCPAPSLLSGEQEIMEMYKCKRERGKLTDEDEEEEEEEKRASKRGRETEQCYW